MARNLILLLLIVPCIGVCAGAGAVADGQIQVHISDAVFKALAWGVGIVGLVWGGAELISFIVPSRSPSYLDPMQISDNSAYSGVELDVNGSIIGYRYFDRNENGVFMPVTVMGIVAAPNGYVGGWLSSDRVPTLKNESGIYAAKTPDSPVLDWYNSGESILAKVELSGRVIEHEFGYRAQNCRILEVYEQQQEIDDGSW